jgi:hypothetical protein
MAARARLRRGNHPSASGHDAPDSLAQHGRCRFRRQFDLKTHQEINNAHHYKKEAASGP